MTLKKRISRICIKGFKTLESLENYEPSALNVFIGPNGAGKSNFIAFFRMMSWMMEENLKLHIAQKGGASNHLFDGPAKTREIECEITLSTERGKNDYGFRLGYAAEDTFVFLEEKYRFVPDNAQPPYKWTYLDAGHRETKLRDASRERGATPKMIYNLLRGCVVHQFHNTSDTARIKQKWLVEDGDYLKEDAANLAPFLLMLSGKHPKEYARIVGWCRQILPFFDNFVLKPDGDYILLRWKEKGSDLILNSSVASDGMLRVLSMIALLGQPEERFPDVLLLDEPELGLHPSAIELVGALLRTVSEHTQVFVATQSPYLLNEFGPEDVTVVERHGRASSFKRLDQEGLARWLDEYSLADLWWKNVLGGKP